MPSRLRHVACHEVLFLVRMIRRCGTTPQYDICPGFVCDGMQYLVSITSEPQGFVLPETLASGDVVCSGLHPSA
jgi:hypothetical protein